MNEEWRPEDDSFIVRVKAVVMTRDESSGGWLAQDGGLSRVGVCRLLPDLLPGRFSFLIHGERLKDRQVMLKCFLKKDLVYTKATPTFHHWKVDNRKCGLTFQSPSDARAFDRGVRKALEDLTEGSTTSSSTLQNETELGDDDVFTDCGKNAAEPSTVPAWRGSVPHSCGSTLTPPMWSSCLQAVHIIPHRVGFQMDEDDIVRINPRERGWLTGYEDYRHANSTQDNLAPPHTPDTYVHFTKKDAPKRDHLHPFPLSCGVRPCCDSKAGCSDLGGAHRTVVTVPPRPLPPKCKRHAEDAEHVRCVYCQDMFRLEENWRGRCQEAPDPVRTCIRRVSFIWCADSLLYHCMSDPEGEYFDPCSCDTRDEHFCLRWAALVGLSLLAPCMCCYGPLRACHRCGVACRCCGGKHKAAS
uniref:Sprouty-related, EVH1 domain-containing protein 2 n=1 Tax=Oryzias latipes TaxID=8090 RepID=A0A3P9JV51_ORYLA